MERRRVTLTPYQKQIIRQKAIDRHIAGKQARELLAGIPRCSCHDYLEPLCPNRRKNETGT